MTDWVAHVASAQLVGILWVDTLFGTFERQDVQRFERQVVWPLGAGVLASVAVGLYQMSVDPVAFNATVYGGTGRAAGLMQDSNVFGTISAMWIAALVAAALRAGRAVRWTAIVAAPAALATVWGSGSRTGLLAAGCATLAAGYGVWKALPSARARITSAASGAVIAAMMFVFITCSSGTSGPVDRVQLALERSWGVDQSLIKYLWERGGHGLAAIQMIREHPWVGVGVGAFHSLVSQFSVALGPAMTVGPDNAQNWFRHQLAELGILGGLGWVVFAAILAITLVRSWQGKDKDVRAVVVAGAIVGLGMASLFGMPTQHVATLATLWTFVFWHHRLRAMPDAATGWHPLGWHWAVVAAIGVVFAVGTLETARTDLRMPARAVRFSRPYALGFFEPVESSSTRFRWTGRRAVDVFQTREPYLKLTFWAEHPDLATEPVRVRIWRGDERIGNVTLSTPSRVTWYVRTPTDTEWMMLEVEISRTWPLTTAGADQSKEVGLVIADWEFVEHPASDFPVVN